MRPRNQTSRNQLTTVLARRAAASAGTLAEQLGVSVPTLHRMLQEQGRAVVTAGSARRTRYALRRPLRGETAELPLYAVDGAGRAALVSHLALVHPQGSRMSLAGSGWPVPDEARDGWWDGLPYPLVDMRPQGYLGRQLARAQHRALAVPANPDEWSDDDVVYGLSRLGSHVSGNLILGDAAFEHWQAQKLSPPETMTPLQPRAIAKAYVRLAEQAVGAGVAGSSTAGEFPKFPALRERAGSGTPHVLVKFSGSEVSGAVQRWADLLVCEHLALTNVATLPGVAAAHSHVLAHGGRCFLEVERFDRQGLFGRSPLVSLGTLNAALVGDGTADWTRLATRLQALGCLDAGTVQRIAQLWWFGRLIANSDMHTGNLSFQPQQASGLLALAPAYDMLPMLYAPLAGGELPVRGFEPPLPLPPQRSTWMTACSAALEFWHGAAKDSRISAAFQTVCRANAGKLQNVADRV